MEEFFIVDFHIGFEPILLRAVERIVEDLLAALVIIMKGIGGKGRRDSRRQYRAIVAI